MTTTEQFRLDTLPVEIIHRILSQGPCTNALALTRVNKSLRAISTDPLVYQHIVEFGNGIHEHYDDLQPEHFRTWWVNRGFSHEQDWRVCAKWALADMKAREAFYQKGKTGSDASALLSELFSQGHRFALSIATQEHDAETYLYGVDFWYGRLADMQIKEEDRGALRPDHVERITRAAFVYACRCTMLPMTAKEVAPLRPTSDRRRDYHRLNWYLPSTLSNAVVNYVSIPELSHHIWDLHPSVIASRILTFEPDNAESELYGTRALTLCTIMAGILHRRLDLVIDQNTFFHRARAEGHRNMRPPLAVDIPFESVFPTTPPYAAGKFTSGASPFMTRHVPVMTSRDFLMDGEWIGYYNYAYLSHAPHWDTMMHGIFFKVTRESADQIDINARGEDAIGEFTLVGTISKTHGWVRMTKDYVGTDISWDWVAVMTAFGIVGGWGESSGGWFWLWKKAWSK